MIVIAFKKYFSIFSGIAHCVGCFKNRQNQLNCIVSNCDQITGANYFIVNSKVFFTFNHK